MPKFQIDGRVYLANDFTLDVEAEDELTAQRVAKRIAWESSWSGAVIQKVQIQAVRDAELLAALNASARREQFARSEPSRPQPACGAVATEPRSTVFDAELDELEDGFENEDSNNAE